LIKPVTFRGVLCPAQVEYEVRRSRFIASVARTASELEAADFIDGISTEHGTASHNVYAYRVGLGVPIERYSDDGEPSGTAGPPALEVLKQRGLLNVTVVVTRYFGGVKLGGGGLVRAYSHACSVGVDAAQEVSWVAYRELGARVDYTSHGRVEYLIRQARCPVLNVEYTSEVTIRFRVRYDEVARWETDLLELTSGGADIFHGDWSYLPEDTDGNLLAGIEPFRPPELE